MNPGRRGPPRLTDPEILREVDEELAFHLEGVEQDLVARGWTPEEARAEARRRFGDLEAAREACAAAHGRRGREGRMGGGAWEGLRQDLTAALRGLRADPGYAGLVTGTLAGAIAAVTVVVSLAVPYFVRPLPFHDPGRLVQLGHLDPRYGDAGRFSRLTVDDLRARSRSLESVGVYRYGDANLTGEAGPERVVVGTLSGNLPGLLGTPPARGRLFTARDAGPSAPPVALVDWGLWQRRWGGDPELVGRTVELDGVAHTVVGVMPRDFSFPFGSVRIWTPVRSSASEEVRSRTGWIPVARLAPGWSREAAQTELSTLHAELASLHPEAEGRFLDIRLIPLREALNFAWEILRNGFAVLLGAVLLVLLLACVNVAGLTLARSRARTREVAIRAALGAGRGRIVRQFLVEGILLAGAGGIVGTLLAAAVVGTVGPFVPEDLYRVGTARIDLRVLAATAAVTLATPLLFALAPARRLAARDLASTLRSGGRGASAPLRARRALVAVQIALAVVLVTGTALMLRSLQEVQEVELGFRTDGLLTVEITPPASTYPTARELDTYFRSAVRGIASLPGVEGVGQVYPLPLNHETLEQPFTVPGADGADAGTPPSALRAAVDPGYFRAMGIGLEAGRTFRDGDRDGPPVVVVSRSFAELHLPGPEPVGRTVRLGAGADGVDATVVGVVADVVHSGIGSGPPDRHLYRPLSQAPVRRRFLVVRESGQRSGAAPAIREALAGLDPALPVSLRPMDEIVLESTYPWAVGSLFLAVFGAGALLLASVGVYGLVAYSVAQRRREIGVRMALGARAPQVRRLVVGEGLRLALTGGAVGLVGALLLAQAAQAVLFRVRPSDPLALAAVVVLLLAVTVAASLVPAFRATRLDPARILGVD